LYSIGKNKTKTAEGVRLEQWTAMVIGELFLNPSILKVAFDFYNEDMKKLSQVGSNGEDIILIVNAWE